MPNFPADSNDTMFYSDIDWRSADTYQGRLWGQWLLNGNPISTADDLPSTNVKDFGAIGDGTTDDRASIQATIDSVASTGGGVVFFPQGTYKVNGTIKVPSFICLMGVGGAYRATEYGINPADAASAIVHGTGTFHLIENSDTVNGNVSIEIRGLRLQQASENGDAAIIHFGKVRRSLISDCYLQGAATTSRNGFLYDNISEHNCVTQTQFEGCGIKSSGSANRLVMNQCEIGAGGISITDGFDHIITNCDLYNDGVSGSFAAYPYIIFASRTIGLMVLNNQVSSSLRHGMYLAGVARSTVTGNTVKNSSRETTNVWSGIVLDTVAAPNPCQYNTVTNNTCWDTLGAAGTQKNGILITSTVAGSTNNNLITDNILIGNKGAGAATATGISNTWRDNLGSTIDDGPISVKDYGAKGDGTTNDSVAFQAACDAVSGGQTLKSVPGSTYLFNTEIQLRKDGGIYDFTGSIFIGPTGGVVNGGLITIGDRSVPTHIVSDVTVMGGHFRPQNVIDNGLSVLCATRARLLSQTADITNGQRGIAIQTTNAFGGGSVPIKDIIVDGFTCWGGGVNGVNIDTTGGNVVSDVVVRDILVIGAQIGFRLSAGTDAFRVDRAILDNATFIGCATGITWFRTTDSAISNVDILATTTRGIDCRLPEGNTWNNIRVTCTTGDGIAITLGDENNFSDLSVKGGTMGLFVNSTDTVVNGLTLINCTTGLSTTDLMRTKFNDVVFENCATPVNAWRDSDRYENLSMRDVNAIYPYFRPARAITADRTLDITDAGRVLEVNIGTAVNITIPPNSAVPFPVGTEFTLYRHGAGTVTPVQGAGVVIRNLLAIAAQYGTARFRKRGPDEWIQT